MYIYIYIKLVQPHHILQSPAFNSSIQKETNTSSATSSLPPRLHHLRGETHRLERTGTCRGECRPLPTPPGVQRWEGPLQRNGLSLLRVRNPLLGHLGAWVNHLGSSSASWEVFLAHVQDCAWMIRWENQFKTSIPFQHLFGLFALVCGFSLLFKSRSFACIILIRLLFLHVPSLSEETLFKNPPAPKVLRRCLSSRKPLELLDCIA